MTDQVIIPINHIERKPNSQKYRIAGKGVTVEFLSRLIDDSDWPVSRICENYDLTPAEVYAAWAFYYDHKEEIDQNIVEGENVFDQHAEEDSARHEKLKQQYQSTTGKPYPNE